MLDEFTKGYLCAVANLIMDHDQPHMAKDLLKAIGHIPWKSIPEFDRDVFRKAKLRDCFK